MAWIAQPDAGDSIFDAYRRAYGIDHIVQVHGGAPEAMKAHMDLYRTLMFGSFELSRAQREMIAVTVSELNHCHY
ncbi:MAG: carboxymuconolactone decarboxylase family protein [Planctomycetes bacterium]|nr:carboxymuconolactone decarboxylase family protein [Planctomycetota bacterium]